MSEPDDWARLRQALENEPGLATWHEIVTALASIDAELLGEAVLMCSRMLERWPLSIPRPPETAWLEPLSAGDRCDPRIELVHGPGGVYVEAWIASDGGEEAETEILAMSLSEAASELAVFLLSFEDGTRSMAEAGARAHVIAYGRVLDELDLLGHLQFFIGEHAFRAEGSEIWLRSWFERVETETPPGRPAPVLDVRVDTESLPRSAGELGDAFSDFSPLVVLDLEGEPWELLSEKEVEVRSRSAKNAPGLGRRGVSFPHLPGQESAEQMADLLVRYLEWCGGIDFARGFSTPDGLRRSLRRSLDQEGETEHILSALRRSKVCVGSFQETVLGLFALQSYESWTLLRQQLTQWLDSGELLLEEGRDPDTLLPLVAWVLEEHEPGERGSAMAEALLEHPFVEDLFVTDDKLERDLESLAEETR